MRPLDHEFPSAIARSPQGGRARSGGSEAPLTITCVAESTRIVVMLYGELDIAGTPTFIATMTEAEQYRLPIDIDCAALTFIDASGIGSIVRATRADPRTHLVNVPRRVADLFEVVGLGALVHRRRQHPIAIAVGGGVDTLEATRVGEIFLNANAEGCHYEVVAVAPPLVGPADVHSIGNSSPLRDQFDSPLRAVVVPPITRWMGFSPDAPAALWLASLAAPAEHVIAIGTGVFLLAAAGLLDGHDVVADKSYASELAAVAPDTRVHRGVTAMIDGRLGTAAGSRQAVALCTALIESDYGWRVRRGLSARLRTPSSELRAPLASSMNATLMNGIVA